VLPDDRVVLLTSCSILLVHAPGFAQLDGAAEIGGHCGGLLGFIEARSSNCFWVCEGCSEKF
jgi:hypothetical protein